MNLRVGIAILVLLVGGFFLKQKLAPDNPKTVRARLSDVQGLPIGAPVSVAGLPVGKIVDRKIGPGYAEIYIQFDSSIHLHADATLYKNRTSILSGPSLEIDPGKSSDELPGNYIERVVETSPIGDVLYDITEALPAFHQMSDLAQRRTNEMRVQINGPLRDRIKEFDQATQKIQSEMHHRLRAMNEALGASESIQFDARGAITPSIDRAEELSKFARESLERARSWVTQSASAARREVDDTEFDWSPYSDPIGNVDEGQGVLGSLLNSSEPHDDIVEMTGKVRDYVRSVVNWQMRVGLRGEYSPLSGHARAYVTIKAGRTNQFYYLELVTSTQGNKPEISLAYDDATGTWRRGITIRNELRITAQWAKRVGPAILRYGLKESSFGAGADLELFDSRLELSADLFEFGYADRPHLKLAASYELFANLYINAGLDDILNPGQDYTILANDTPPNTLDTYHVGRDYFLGASLRFSDRDLAILMRIGGNALLRLGND